MFTTHCRSTIQTSQKADHCGLHNGMSLERGQTTAFIIGNRRRNRRPMRLQVPRSPFTPFQATYWTIHQRLAHWQEMKSFPPHFRLALHSHLFRPARNRPREIGEARVCHQVRRLMPRCYSMQYGWLGSDRDSGYSPKVRFVNMPNISYHKVVEFNHFMIMASHILRSMVNMIQ